MERDRRDFPRAAVGIVVDLRLADGRVVSGTARDVSLRGLFLPETTDVPIGTEGRVRLLLGGRMSDLALEARGVVVRKTAEGLGIDFHAINLEALACLQGLVATAIESHLGLDPSDSR